MDEVETITRRLVSGDTRLLTLTGPAGVGKTRLALAAATQLSDQFPDRFPDGVAVVDLTPIRDYKLVAPTIAHALGFADTGPRPLTERLREALRERKQLLALDNFEQVRPAAAQLADLLADCPGLVLLVTSRVPLRVRWERVLRVSPLPVPDLDATLPPVEELAVIPSIALFMERARAQRADFVLNEGQAPLIARLVAQLDGLPLALELAAARLDTLPLAVIVRRLGDRLRLLRSEAPDMPERQRSLEAAVGWSYDLLSDSEQRLFRCLGVFAGQVSPDANTTVARAAFPDNEGAAEARPGAAGGGDERHALEALTSLAEKSLVLPAQTDGEDRRDVQQEDDEPAFGMLETVREYAWERLAARGELAAARQAHAHYFLQLAEQADPLLRGRDQRAWFLRLERERDNLRAALRWLLDQNEGRERDLGLRLVSALGWFWLMRGYHVEGWGWIKETLGRASETADLAIRVRALNSAGLLLLAQGDLSQARVVLEEALDLGQHRNDPAGVADALCFLGACAVAAGEQVEGIRLLHEALARWEALGERFSSGAMLTLYSLGAAAFASGDFNEAVAFQSAALSQCEAASDTRAIGATHFGLAMILQRQGDLPGAVWHVREGLEASIRLHDRFLLGWGARATLALLDQQTNAVGRARLLGAADAAVQATGGTSTVWETVAARQVMAEPRQRPEREELGTAYREGRSLPFIEVAALALALLGDFAQRLALSQLS
jgi:predicted ATPase